MFSTTAVRLIVAVAFVLAAAGLARCAEPKKSAPPAAKQAALPASHSSGAEDAKPAPASSDSSPLGGSARDRVTKAIEAANTPNRELVREGSKLVDEVGYFRLTGDRATFFYQEGGVQINALENLALERIARLVGETPDQLEWSISGAVTEYRGNNFLLITRAVIKRKAPNRTAAAR